jgi:hypothetical protein
MGGGGGGFLSGFPRDWAVVWWNLVEVVMMKV